MFIPLSSEKDLKKRGKRRKKREKVSLHAGIVLVPGCGKRGYRAYGFAK